MTTLVRDIAQKILEGFDKHYRVFLDASATARGMFERSEWVPLRQSNVERIQGYDRRVRETVIRLSKDHPDAAHDESIWPQVKIAFIGLLYNHKQPECAETFFNSVACRVLHRRYYNNEYIFWRPAVSTAYLTGEKPVYRCYYPEVLDGPLDGIFRRLLQDFELKSIWQDFERDVSRMTQAVEEIYPAVDKRRPNFQVQVISSLFFRNRAAYIVGRAVNGRRIYPFVIPLLKDENGKLYADTLLLDRRNIGRVFSLVRSYFMVAMEVPSAVVEFLQTLLPTYPRAEIYTMLGLQKQGKTLFYRDLSHHLAHSTDQFVVAPGIRGMVMTVFTLPSFPFVFKVIRDRFEPPKTSDAAHVQERYQLVKHHDRVGRMADTLEYSHVAFPRDRISPELLEELQRLIPSSLKYEDDQLVIKHLYIERRLQPLDIFIRTASDAALRDAMRDYGQAIKDLMAANIFPGDLLLKNFGVTRYGRVVFYDYDEITYLTECNFRFLPSARSDDEEMSSEPWFQVQEHDVFPEQFPTFLVPQGKVRDLFMEHHSDLADPRYWNARKDRLLEGVTEEFFPYPQKLRFQHRFDGVKLRPVESSDAPLMA